MQAKLSKPEPGRAYSKKEREAQMNKVLDLIRFEEISVNELCKRYKDEIPDRKTIRLWRYKYPEFDAQCREALKVGVGFTAEDMLVDAKVKVPAKYYILDEKGNRRIDPSYPQLKRIYIDTLKFFLAKVLPKTYGDKLQLDEDDAKKLIPWIINLKRGEENKDGSE
jgi:hypothetical protein